VPPILPDRYRLNVRLGRDGDVEEWLATDEQLDRPVLVRYLVPEADVDRRSEFLAVVRQAAAANHPHLQRVYAAGDREGAYSVSEWDGAVSVADRLRAGETLPVSEFLPNAAGLASGLAEFHLPGGVHGAIDVSTIHFSSAHPAKLGGWGRASRGTSAEEDTASLAAALRIAVTGADSASIRPSHVAEGLSPDADEALAAAERGDLDARGLAEALLATPSTPPARDEPAAGWRWALVFGGILIAIVVIAGIGLAIDVDETSPFFFPATGDAETTTTTAAAPTVTDQTGDFGMVAFPRVFDPLGDGVENDEQLRGLIDGDAASTWFTEAYSEPLQQIKPGVGIAFAVEGDPTRVQLLGTPGTRFRLGWADETTELAGFEDVGSGTLLEAPTEMRLPPRRGGVWLLWLVELPQGEDGSFQSELTTVRFLI